MLSLTLSVIRNMQSAVRLIIGLWNKADLKCECDCVQEQLWEQRTSISIYTNLTWWEKFYISFQVDILAFYFSFAKKNASPAVDWFLLTQKKLHVIDKIIMLLIERHLRSINNALLHKYQCWPLTTPKLSSAQLTMLFFISTNVDLNYP